MSEWLSRRLAEQRIIKEEEQGLYQYGISNGLVILLNVFTALMIGLLSGHLVTAIVFTLFFMMLRSYSGGYHSDSRLFCYVTSSAVLLIPVYTSQLMRNIPPMAVISILCLASCIIWQLSPITHVLKTLSWTDIVTQDFCRGEMFVEEKGKLFTYRAVTGRQDYK